MSATWHQLEQPDELRVPFIFVPHGHPEPKEWMARHPGWVKFPAVMVPRTEPDPQPASPAAAWPPAAPAPMPASLAMQGPVAEVAAVPQPPPAPELLIDGMSAEVRERYAARNYDPIAAYLAINRYIETVIGPGRRPAGQPATGSDEIAAAAAPRDATTAPSPAAPGRLDPRWVKTADDDLRNPAANAYDDVLKREIEEYKRRFAGVPGIESLDFRLLKAQLLTETGPSNPQWLTLPAQIGDPRNPAYGALQRHEEGSDLVMSPALQKDIATAPITDPVLNVRAAIAYILTKAARFRLVSRVDPNDVSLREHVVRRGESFPTIARSEYTTITELHRDNPRIGITLYEGQKLKFRRASMIPEIYAFKTIDIHLLATKYNTGDKNYESKVRYILSKME